MNDSLFIRRAAPPEPVARILSRLRAGGYFAYAVGGCVRDLLLGRRAHDWDVATSALPEQVQALFDRVYATGLPHGTVTVLEKGVAVEVTTFRTEGAYSDGRRPDSVRFVGTLPDDLARRDFTINAMALDEDGLVIDPFGGQDDLRARVIRCVGEPRERFTEDALRMWRAFRFSAALGFGIDPGTWDAIVVCAPLTGRLSAERVAAEVGKMLLSGGAARLADALPLGLLDAFLSARPSVILPFGIIKTLPRRPDCRWAGFTALLRQAGCLSEAGAFLRALRLPSRVVKPAAFGVEYALSYPMPAADVEWRHLCCQHGIPDALCAAASADVLCSGGQGSTVSGQASAVRVLRRVLKNKPCLSVRELKVSGEQLRQAGYEGPAIGRAQRLLLEHVLDHPGDNNQQALWGFLGMRDEEYMIHKCLASKGPVGE